MSQGSRHESPIRVVTMMSVLARRALLSIPPPPITGTPPQPRWGGKPEKVGAHEEMSPSPRGWLWPRGGVHSFPRSKPSFSPSADVDTR